MDRLHLDESESAEIALDLKHLRQVSDAFWRRAGDCGFVDYERMLKRSDRSLLSEAVCTLVKAYESGSLLEEERSLDLISDGVSLYRDAQRRCLHEAIFVYLLCAESAASRGRTALFKKQSGAVDGLVSFGLSFGLVSPEEYGVYFEQLADMASRL